MDEIGTHESVASPSEASRIDWNGPVARFWADHDDRYDGLLAGHGDALFAAAAPVPGEHVLDIGCGYGSTTLRAAEAVARGAGTALGADISHAMIGRLAPVQRSRAPATSVSRLVIFRRPTSVAPRSISPSAVMA